MHQRGRVLPQQQIERDGMRFCAGVRDWVTYCSRETPTTVSELFGDTDDALFSRVLANKDHVLQPYLTGRPSTQYNLRAKRHNKD